MKAREAFWLFASRAGDDDPYLGTGLPWARNGSKITPVEGAGYLGIDNIIMVTSDDGDPAPFTSRAEQFMFGFAPMRQVVWTSVGSGGYRFGNEEEHIAQLAQRHPNLVGAMADDLLVRFRELEPAERERQAAALLKEVREGLDKAGRPLKLFVTFYDHELDKFTPELIQYVDVITYWTWEFGDLDRLEENFARLEQAFPGKELMLGVYLFDYVSRQPVPIPQMERQCATGLEWLRQGRISGMVFLSNTVMGIGSPVDPWLREWIARHGDTTL